MCLKIKNDFLPNSWVEEEKSMEWRNAEDCRPRKCRRKCSLSTKAGTPSAPAADAPGSPARLRDGPGAAAAHVALGPRLRGGAEARTAGDLRSGGAETGHGQRGEAAARDQREAEGARRTHTPACPPTSTRWEQGLGLHDTWIPSHQ